MPGLTTLVTIASRALIEHGPRILVNYGIPAIEGALRRPERHRPRFDALLVDRINAALPAWRRPWTPDEAYEFATFFLRVAPAEPAATRREQRAETRGAEHVETRREERAETRSDEASAVRAAHPNAAAASSEASPDASGAVADGADPRVEWSVEPRVVAELMVRGAMLADDDFAALRDDVEAALGDVLAYAQALPALHRRRAVGPGMTTRAQRPDDVNAATWLFVPLALPSAVAGYVADQASRRRSIEIAKRFIELLERCGLSSPAIRRFLIDQHIAADVVDAALAAYHRGG